MNFLEKLKNDRQDLISKLCDNIDSLERIALEQQAEIDYLTNKLECLLCHATDGRLSKHNYPLKVMETGVTDAMNGNYNQGYDDGIKEFVERLKQGCPGDLLVISFDALDKLGEEMTGGDNE